MMNRVLKQPSEAEKFVFDDLRFWVWAFDQFIGDVRDLLPNPGNLPQQYTLEHLDRFLQTEFDADAEHQRYWWLYYDRAAEAIPLLESDGPEHYNYPVEGFSTHMDFNKIREFKEEEAYINLVGANVDRKMGDLSSFKPNFYAKPRDPEQKQQLDTLNRWAKQIRDNNNFESDWNNAKFDMITIGSGVFQMGHGVNYNSSELGLFKSFMRNKEYLTQAEARRFGDIFRYHQINYIPSFNVVRFRGATGSKSKSFMHKVHRQLHHFEHVSVADAKSRYPEYAHKIHPRIDQKCLEISPEMTLIEHQVKDMVTVFHHRVKFPVRETIEVPILMNSGQIEHYYVEQPRYAVGRITRVAGAGIVDMDLDYYDHGQMDYIQMVNYPSTKHSAGIGMIKFGRDPAIVHNKLHNGALRYFGRQIKGGGFYVDGVIKDDDLKDMSKGNRWVKVDLSKLKNYTNRNDTLRISDFIQDQRPPSFPAAWTGLMNLEQEALDRSMRSGAAWRGERVGYSGAQQQIASQDSALQHVNTHQELKDRVKEGSDILFSNIIQFDGQRHIEFTAENEFGELENYELNSPQMPIEKYDPEMGDYKVVPTFIKNEIGKMNFVTSIEPESIVPDRPADKANFFIQMLQFLFPYVQNPQGRILLRGFQHEGLRIPGLDTSIDQIEALDKQTMQMQSQLADIEKEYQKLQDDREFAKDKTELNQNLLRLTHKFVSDLVRANPQTLQQLLGQNQNNVSANLLQAIQSLLTGQANQAGRPPTMNGGPQMGGQPPQIGGAGQDQPQQGQQLEIPNLQNMMQNQ